MQLTVKIGHLAHGYITINYSNKRVLQAAPHYWWLKYGFSLSFLIVKIIM
ncbi:protein of unknown function [Vibrio tapetis subsp. tapetis]|uniref:Uncharacterized protein n=1 Tax=Vibrio tapetis subsp. tapetis TaxID=1671868 RepID=A0A2N8ZAZ1_9VIBR|nr:protein of unknown function [Vibrio tapetis subsp. tapetis]